MPELPEVEASRQLLEKWAVGRRITAVSAIETGGGPRAGLFDEIICANVVSAAALTAALIGRTPRAAHRLGKQLWLAFDNAPSLALHLGMTGAVCVRAPKGAVTAAKYISRKDIAADGSWPPRFTKLELEFDGGARVSFSDPRRLGRIRLLSGNARESPCLASLAPDALLALPAPDAFASALAARGATPVKAVLLDQQGIVSGLGNYLVDEICYWAGLHPETAAAALAPAAGAALRDVVADVLAVAVAAEADYALFPPEWLFHSRWGKGRDSAPRDAAGNALTFVTVGGRTSAVAAARQGSRGLKSPGAVAALDNLPVPGARGSGVVVAGSAAAKAAAAPAVIGAAAAIPTQQRERVMKSGKLAHTDVSAAAADSALFVPAPPREMSVVTQTRRSRSSKEAPALASETPAAPSRKRARARETSSIAATGSSAAASAAPGRGVRERRGAAVRPVGKQKKSRP